MSVMELLELTLGAVMVVLAVIAVNSRKKVTSVIMLSAISMLAVVLFVVMRAPDVAITEAVIGSGLVTVLFVFTLFSKKNEGEDV
jgi:energy-converting hydrogenase B subunit D